MTDHRSAITGQYVTADHAEANPDTTVSESPCTECERMLDAILLQKSAIDGYREELERLRAAEPIVRTVGDLTARHIGQSVRVFEGPFFTLRHLSSFIRGESTDYIELGAEWDDDPDEWEYFETPLDTPCEVLS